MAEKRITVKIECKRKTFYLAFLKHWRSRLNENEKDLKMSRNVYLAMEALKRYPLQVLGIHALKQIKGFGDVLASRCDAAWNVACSNQLCELTMTDVKALNSSNFDKLIFETRDAKAKNADARKENATKRKPKITDIPDSDDEFVEKTEEPRTKKIRLERLNSEPLMQSPSSVPLSRWNSEILSKPNIVCTSTAKLTSTSREREFEELSEDDIQFVQPSSSITTGSSNSFRATTANKCSAISSSHSTNEVNICTGVSPVKASSSLQRLPSATQILSEGEIRFDRCHPFQQPEVILILDHREHQGKKKAGKAIIDALDKLGMRYELRILSVGDYLWVARKIDGSEIVLDQVIERKTWTDLHSSITNHRYEDQKQRLRDVPCKEKVYLIEGPKMNHHGSNAERNETALRQAVVTTMLRDDFRIQMTDNAKKTAEYLKIVTRRFMEKVQRESMTGIVFEDLQIIGKKDTPHTIKELWIRQLTVVPGMSVTRAGIVAERFPSMASLLKFFNTRSGDRSMLINSTLPSIPKPVSAQLAKFFC